MIIFFKEEHSDPSDVAARRLAFAQLTSGLLMPFHATNCLKEATKGVVQQPGGPVFKEPGHLLLRIMLEFAWAFATMALTSPTSVHAHLKMSSILSYTMYASIYMYMQLFRFTATYRTENGQSSL